VKRVLIFGTVLALAFSASTADAKKKRKPPKEEPKVEQKVEQPPPPPVKVDAKVDEEAKKREEEQRRVEAAKKKLELENRKGSKITPGTASRWSNKGAMTPVVSEVPLTAPLPDRAKPIEPGTVETPGQALIGEEELLQARLYYSMSHLETRGQDFVYAPVNNGVEVVRRPWDNDLDLYRARASIAYEKIAGSDFGLHLDLEYRGRWSGSYPTDHRINELYVSYGLADFRRDDGPTFGIALGRLAIREAGYAQTDGAVFRVQLSPDLKLGAFGGVTGNIKRRSSRRRGCAAAASSASAPVASSPTLRRW
jgi:hypothetical protein